MVEDAPSPPKTNSPPPGTSRRRSNTALEDQHRLSTRFSSSSLDPTEIGIRRRSSNFSELSYEARRHLRTSTDDLLSPHPGDGELHRQREATPWDSAPLAFALLPALGGLVFKNGSSVVTDVMLLGLAAVFLNWSVRIPWDWYHSAQTTRKVEEGLDEVYDGESVREGLPHSQTMIEEVPEDCAADMDEPASSDAPTTHRRAREKATSELYQHEILALLCCFLFPPLGAYLLHTLRSQLSRPSEGLVSNYNLTIFLLASEIRPLSHLVKLIRARTLHLQRIAASDSLSDSLASSKANLLDITNRITCLESRSNSPTSPSTASIADAPSINKVLTEVRRSLQPELDALNRAVRRYEKRATLQAFQTESRLKDIESRLNDAVSLAAAAANGGLTIKTVGLSHGVMGILKTSVDGMARIAILPLQVVGLLITVPWTVTRGMAEGGWERFSEVTGMRGSRASKGEKIRMGLNGSGIAASANMRREGKRRGEIMMGRSGKKVG